MSPERKSEITSVSRTTTNTPHKVLTSLNLLKLVAKLNEAYDIKITAMHLMPENFNSAEAIYALIEKLS